MGVGMREGSWAGVQHRQGCRAARGDSQEAQEGVGSLQEQHLKAVWGENDEGIC